METKGKREDKKKRDLKRKWEDEKKTGRLRENGGENGEQILRIQCEGQNTWY